MIRFWPLLGASALFAVLAFACKGDSADKKYSAVVETTKGKFTIELRPDIALQTVNSFIFLARDGFYNGVTFHRVIRDVPGKPDFVAQTGDPPGTGSGGPGHPLPPG